MSLSRLIIVSELSSQVVSGYRVLSVIENSEGMNAVAVRCGRTNTAA